MADVITELLTGERTTSRIGRHPKQHLTAVFDITRMGDDPCVPVGRDHRTATIAQWKALIARDGGCIGCGADPSRCEAHHIIAWDARGPTDITNLVLVCSRCHHDLHDRDMQLVPTATGWTIQPRAGPSPPDPPLPHRNQPGNKLTQTRPRRRREGRRSRRSRGRVAR